MTERRIFAVDDRGVVLPAAADPRTTYDVLLNGQHVWSLSPVRDADDAGRVPWPKALRRFLDGTAEVTLRGHVDGGTLGTAVHRFGESAEPVAVLDDQGRALLLDKWGRLIRPLAEDDTTLVDELMGAVARLLDELAEHCGVPAFIAYGTLLGAVRDGRLIGHDNDVDLAYLSSHEYPVDVARESFRIQRTLTDRGWHVRRGSASRLNVRLGLSDGSMRFVDVFTSHWTEGTLYVARDIGAAIDRAQVLPLGTVDLQGHRLPVPAEPEVLLAAAYGEGWRVPDPSFAYDTPRWLSRRFGGWYGGLMASRKHWDSFYSQQRGAVPSEPSSFARWVASTYPSDRRLVDVGSGTGRDAYYFAGEGRPVLGIDYSLGVLARTRRYATSHDLPADFEALNLYDSRGVLALGARLAREEPCDIYGRFVLHAMSDLGRDNFWRLSSMALRRGGRCYLEFRTHRDRRSTHAFGKHFRRYLRPQQVVSEIQAAGGRVVYRKSGQGLAPFGDEDPHVCRLVAAWAPVAGRRLTG